MSEVLSRMQQSMRGQRSKAQISKRLFLALFLLGSAPFAAAWSPGTGDADATGNFSVDTTNRTDVLAFYNTIYSSSEGYASEIDWTGNIAAGNAGATGSAFKLDVLRRINFYRALVGVSTNISFSSTEGGNDQLAALMFSANNALSHTPPVTWLDYTANAAKAAGSSNIFLGSYGPPAVDGYLVDPGANNVILGHRRWLLYSAADVMGTGDVAPTATFNYSNAIWVFPTGNLQVTPKFTAWPNAGYSPFSLMPARWSVSYPGADFTHATVSMKKGSSTVSTSVITRTDNGYGDDTFGWEPTGLPTSISGDTAYTITITGVGGTGVPTSFTYTVTLFDPNVLGSSMAIAGLAIPPVAGSTYTFNSILQADSYQLSVAKASTAAWTEGAESSPPPQVETDTTGTYSVLQSSVFRTGSKAFHLAFPDFNDQSFEITRQVIPSSSSVLQFYDMGRYATSTSSLSAQISTDSGNTWTSIWSRNGVGLSSSNWDPAFLANNIRLSSYAGKSVLVRFVFNEGSAGIVIDSSTNSGFFIDDVTITNSTQLSNPVLTTLGGTATSFVLNSATAGSALVSGSGYYLQIRPQVGTRWFAYSPTLLVTPSSSVTVPTNYSGWISSTYPQVTGGANGDYSQDGIANGYKYAFGLNPTVKNSPSALPVAALSGSSLEITYTAPSGITGVTYGAQYSTDLLTWKSLSDSGSGLKHTFKVSTSGKPRLFLRNYLTFAP